ncbi:hypothetical protein ACWDWO_09490 [Actinopolymorpha singaporensis]
MTGNDMPRWSRRGFLAALGGVGVGALAGCGGGEYTQVTGATPREYRRRTHIVAWHSFGGILQEALQKLIDEFNQSQRDVFVEAQFQGSYEQTMQKVAAAIIARQIPDLAVFSEITWRKMHLADALEPLNSYFDDRLGPHTYIDQFIQEGTVQGRTWWIPSARSTPRAFAMGGTYASWYFQNNVWAWGGNFSKGLDISIGDEPALAAGRWMVDFIRTDRAAYLSQTPDIDFGQGVTACTVLSTGSLKNTSELAKAGGFEIGTGFLPEHEGRFGCPPGAAGSGSCGMPRPSASRLRSRSCVSSRSRPSLHSGRWPAVTCRW